MLLIADQSRASGKDIKMYSMNPVTREDSRLDSGEPVPSFGRPDRLKPNQERRAPTVPIASTADLHCARASRQKARQFETEDNVCHTARRARLGRPDTLKNRGRNTGQLNRRLVPNGRRVYASSAHRDSLMENNMDRTAAKHDLQTLQESVPSGSVIVASTGMGPFEQILLDGRHALRADEPVAVGGGDAGPGPYELLLMALGSCTSMTVNMYAARKNWTLNQVVVRLRHDRVHADDCANCEDPKSMIDRILCSIELVGPLDEAQRKQLIEIAKKCPVHRTLTNKIEVRTDLFAS